MGTPGVYNNNLTAEDLVSSTNSQASPITDYDSVLQSGKASYYPARHEDRLTGLVTEFNGTDFKTIYENNIQSYKLAQPNGNFEVSFPAATQSDSVAYNSVLQAAVSNCISLSGNNESNKVTGDVHIDSGNPVGFKADAGGQITFDDNEGVVIQGNAGSVTIRGSGTGVEINGDGGALTLNGGVDGIEINSNNGISISGGNYTVDTSPLNYSQNFSGSYTNRSLVDKEYVDNAIPSGNGFAFGMAAQLIG